MYIEFNNCYYFAFEFFSQEYNGIVFLYKTIKHTTRITSYNIHQKGILYRKKVCVQIMLGKSKNMQKRWFLIPKKQGLANYLNTY